MSAQAIAIFSQGLTAEEVEGLSERLNADVALAGAITTYSARIAPTLRLGEIEGWQPRVRPVHRGLSVAQMWEQGNSVDFIHSRGHFLNVGRRSGVWSMEKWRLLVNIPDLWPLVLPIGRLIMPYFGASKLIYTPDSGGTAGGATYLVEQDKPLEVIEGWLRKRVGPPSASFAAIAAAVREGRQEHVDDGYVIDPFPSG